jgi:hypothetical protein
MSNSTPTRPTGLTFMNLPTSASMSRHRIPSIFVVFSRSIQLTAPFARILTSDGKFIA